MRWPTKVGLGVITLVLLSAIVTSALARSSPGPTEAQVTGEAELSFDVKGIFSTGPKEDKVTVDLGAQFTLSVEVNTLPATGSVGVQAVVRYPAGLTFVSGVVAAGHPLFHLDRPG